MLGISSMDNRMNDPHDWMDLCYHGVLLCMSVAWAGVVALFNLPSP